MKLQYDSVTIYTFLCWNPHSPTVANWNILHCHVDQAKFVPKLLTTQQFQCFFFLTFCLEVRPPIFLEV